MDDRSLVLSASPSSLEFSVYRQSDPEDSRLEVRGRIGGRRGSPRFSAEDGAGLTLDDHPLGAGVQDACAALDVLSVWLRSQYGGARMRAVGHRVVHGGRYPGPTIVTPDVLEDLRRLVPLAPLHQSYSVAAIEAVSQRFPGVPQVACFDTSFHRGHPAVAELIPVPRELWRSGLQRYGFHGLSYEYIASVLPRVAPEIAGGRVIVAHLGSEASLCALKNGTSIDGTLGFSAFDGLCSGTQSGTIDAGVIIHLVRHLKLSPGEVEAMLCKRSGLLGISGISNDVRVLLTSSAPSARLAVAYFVYRVAKEIGALAAVLGGIDGLVFTADVGEHSQEIRERICQASGWLGVDLDTDANERNGPRISRAGRSVSAWVIPTNEELMVARQTALLLGLNAVAA